MDSPFCLSFIEVFLIQFEARGVSNQSMFYSRLSFMLFFLFLFDFMED